jgi:ribosomal protein L17
MSALISQMMILLLLYEINIFINIKIMKRKLKSQKKKVQKYIKATKKEDLASREESKESVASQQNTSKLSAGGVLGKRKAT